MKEYNWYFFDADNTLFDFDKSSELAFESLVSDLSLTNWKELYKTYKKYNSHVWQLLERGEISSDELKSKRFTLFFEEIGFSYDGLEANNLYLQKLVENVRLIDGALDVLNELVVRNKKLLIITNGLKEVQRPRLEKAGLTKYFKGIVVSDEIGIAKPDGGFFKHAEELAGFPPKEKVLVIGDSLNSDIRGGLDYGYDVCWYNPNSIENLTELNPTYLIQNLKELNL
jgi:putative hydrolase of the HAD superfamily